MIQLTRKFDWEQRLNAFLAQHVSTATINYGEFDCAIGLATGAVKAMTGKDLGAKFRRKYTTALEGYKLLASKGIKGLDELAGSMLPPKPVAFAQRGDVVLYQGCLGVCIGQQALFMPAEGEEPGLIRVEALNCERAWAV